MGDVLPEEVLWRKKSPYPKTYDPMYLQLVQGRLEDLYKDAKAPIWQIVDKRALMDLVESESAWPWYGQLMKTPQTIAYMLQINHWLVKFNVNII